MIHSITPRDIYRFTCGDCHIFAYALHRITGWPVATFVDDGGEAITHAFCVMPDGRAADIQGLHLMRDFKRSWWKPTGVKIHGDLIRDAEWGRRTAFGEYSRKRARQL